MNGESRIGAGKAAPDWLLRAAVLAALLLLFRAAVWAQAPSYTVEGIVNTPDFAPGPIAPNSLVSIFGSKLAWSEQGVGPEHLVDGRLPVSLNGVQVHVSELAAPLFFVSDKQINFLMPSNQIEGNVTVRVWRQGLAGPAIALKLAAAAPVLFNSPVNDGFAIAQRWPEYSLISPETPAAPGDLVILYAAGLGRTKSYPGRPDEIPMRAGFLERFSDFRIYLDGQPIEPSLVLYAGLAPGFAGLYQINFWLPKTVGANPEIRIAVANQTSPVGLKLALATPPQPAASEAR